MRRFIDILWVYQNGKKTFQDAADVWALLIYFSVMTYSQKCPDPHSDVLFPLFPLKVVDHYENPRNVGSLDKNSRNVGTGLVGAPACGDVMKLQVPWIDGSQPFVYMKNF